MTPATRGGGRPKGSKGHRNKGLQKRCDCDRRRWSACDHPWFFNFAFRSVNYRFNLNDEVNQATLAKSEAERWRDEIRAQIRAGTLG